MTPLAFLSLLHAGAVQQGMVEFRFLKGGQKRWMPWPTFPEHPETFLPEQAPAGKDVYFGVALRKDDSSGKAENCKPARQQWCDVDLVDHPEFSDGLSKAGLLEASPEDLAEMKRGLLAHLLKLCDEHAIPPRAAVDSGHGLQLYWVREVATDPAETVRVNRAIAHVIGGDQKSTDFAHILRVPGTQNLKNPARPLPVQVMYEDEAATVTEQALKALPEPVKVAEVPSVPAGGVRTSAGSIPSEDVRKRYAQSALSREAQKLASTGEGGRNQALNDAAFVCGTLVSAGVLDEQDVRIQLTDAAQQVGLALDEITTTLHSGLSAGKAKPRDLSRVGQRPPSAGRGTIGKSGGQGESAPASVAEVLAALPDDKAPSLAQYRDLVLADFHDSGQVYRYHQVWRTWWEYRQGVYVEVLDEVMAQKVDLCLQSYGHTLKNAQVTEITVKIGRDPMIGSRVVDQGAWELNTRSGILDLASGDLYDHTPAYFSIIQSAASYEPFQVSHQWLRFLHQAVPDDGDRELLQMFAGLCLTGDTSPQRALLLIGEGGTGKGTFTRVLQTVLGNLSTSSAIENIKDGSFLVGTLVGKRMCVVSELPRSFDWLPFKRITGEDQISVDVKNKTPYTTKLDMKLVILSNVMPFLGDDVSNNSLLRRFLPVAFNVRPVEQDPTLIDRLTDPDELPGVLNWMLDGLRLLQERGMRFPSSETSSLTREIVEESNRVIAFVRDECRYTPEVTVISADLYDHYRQWCGRNGHKPLSTPTFSKQLLAAGKYYGRPIERIRARTGTIYKHIEISTAPGGWEVDT